MGTILSLVLHPHPPIVITAGVMIFNMHTKYSVLAHNDIVTHLPRVEFPIHYNIYLH